MRLACRLLPAANQPVPLRRGQAAPHAVAGPRLEGVLEAFLSHRAGRADRLGLVGLRFRRREEDVGADVAARRIVEPIGFGHVQIHGKTRHSGLYNDLPGLPIPVLPPEIPPTAGWNSGPPDPFSTQLLAVFGGISPGQPPRDAAELITSVWAVYEPSLFRVPRMITMSPGATSLTVAGSVLVSCELGPVAILTTFPLVSVT